MVGDAFDLERFVRAQASTYARALAELQEGSKRSHWMWFIFPQLRGLGSSAMAQAYGIAGLAEARAYVAHPVLGPRLLECVRALLGHAGRSAESILGGIDALKLCSCLTLFARAAPEVPEFVRALEAFCGGVPDPLTLRMLGDDGAA